MFACNYHPFSWSFHLSPFVLHQIIPSCCSPGCTLQLSACLEAFSCCFSPFFSPGWLLPFSIPFQAWFWLCFLPGPALWLGSCTLGCTRSPIAVLPGHCPKPSAAKPRLPAAPSQARGASGAASPPCQGLPTLLLLLQGRRAPSPPPHALCFPGPDALFSAADAAGVGKITMMQRAWARPGDAGLPLPRAVFPLQH